MNKHLNRRTFLEFLGRGSVGLSVVPAFMLSCDPSKKPKDDGPDQNPVSQVLKGIDPSDEDKVVLAEGFDYDVLVKWGDPISDKDQFGFNNDYIAFMPDSAENPNEGIMWVNHEYTDPRFVSAFTGEQDKTKEQVEKEMYSVGGSIFKVKKNEKGNWEVQNNAPENRRVTAQTEITFNWQEPIAGSDKAMGTLANCSGGITPWGTILTCEENYDSFYGEKDFNTGELTRSRFDYGWLEFFENPSEHYGWVVEVDPKTGESQKHIALGRCAHECATVVELADKRVVVYTGDDANDECLYKFVSSKPGSLSEGTLYVANVEAGRWESLDYASQEVLQENFSSQTEVLIRLREASKLVGGSPLDRPEDIEIDPVNGNVLVALTNNIPKDNYYGSILKLEEKEGDHSAMTFATDTFLAGGEDTGFAAPDNMAFDIKGNLWFTSDISGSKMNKEPYLAFKNNGLFVVPREGEQAGQVIQIASAPSDAEFTGPFFAPDGRTLFLSVQHPGETSPSAEELSSHWPEGGDAIPRPSIIAITGSALDSFQGLA